MTHSHNASITLHDLNHKQTSTRVRRECSDNGPDAIPQCRTQWPLMTYDTLPVDRRRDRFSHADGG